MVKCGLCYATSHVGCIVNKFAAVNGTAMKNSVQWMLDFLNSGNFQFTCTLCVERKQASGNFITDDCQSNADNIPRLFTNVIKQVDDLNKSLQVFTAFVAILPHRSESSSSYSFTSVQFPFYVAIVSKSISATTKKAVTETIKNRENNTRGK